MTQASANCDGLAKVLKYSCRVSIAVCHDDAGNYIAEVNYSELPDKDGNFRDVVTFWTLTFSSPQEAVQSAWNLYNARRNK